MAGSYHHVQLELEEELDDDDCVVQRRGSWDLIEHMGDAQECVEELLFMLGLLTTTEQRHAAISAYYRNKRGELLDGEEETIRIKRVQAIVDEVMNPDDE